MRSTIIVAAALVAGCQSAGETAEDRYAFLEANGASASELCTAAREVEQAYAEDRDGDRYRNWSANAAVQCLRASVARARS